MSFLRFKLGDSVVVRMGEMQQRNAVIKRKKPEAGLYLVRSENSEERWLHESQLLTESEAAFERHRD